MAEGLGAVDQVKVFAVVGESPADSAGLRSGDFIVAVDGRRIIKTEQVFSRLRGAKSGSPSLRIRREGREFGVALPVELGCNQGVLAFIHTGADTLPHRNQHEVMVPTGLLRFARDDDELAVAIAHQIAHHVLGTTRPKRAKDECAADRLGLLIAARAGFDVSKAPDFWDRLAAEEPWKISADFRRRGGGWYELLWHPAMAERAPVIRSTVKEISRQIEGGDPLKP